ncbi:MAG: hypothetical protein AB2693_06215 [Candidatus Thiodiazotropha sp.]
MVDNIEFSSPIGKSDHVSLTWTFHSTTYAAQSQDQTEKCAWYKTDFHFFNDCMLSIDWDNRLKDLDVENSWEAFKAEYEKCVEMYVPYKSHCKERQSPWFSKKVKESVRKKHILFKRYKRTKLYVDKLAYIQQRNITDNLVSKAKREYESKIMKSVKTEPKRFYSYMKSKQKVNVKVPSLQRPDGSMTDNDDENRKVLSDFFCSVFTREPDGPDLPHFDNRCEDSLNSVNISEDIVLKKLNSIKVDKSQGPDGLNPRVLRECSSSVVKPLYIIFKKSLDT